MIRLNVTVNGEAFLLPKHSEDTLKTVLYSLNPFVDSDVISITFEENDTNDVLTVGQICDLLWSIENDSSILPSNDLFGDGDPTTVNSNIIKAVESLRESKIIGGISWFNMINKLAYRGYQLIDNLDGTYNLCIRKGVLTI